MPSKKTSKIQSARSLSELAESLGDGVTAEGLTALRQLHRDRMPKPTDRANRYNVPEFQEWWVMGGRELYNASITDGGKTFSLDSEKLKDQKLVEEIRKLKMANDQTEGKLSDPSDQVRLFALAVQSVDRGLEELIMRLAPKVVGCKDEVDAKLIIEEEVAKLKIQLGDYRHKEEE